MLHRRGDTMEITLARTIKINEGSTLHREHYAYNDAAMPVQIKQAPIVTVGYADRRFQYTSSVDLEVSEPTAAIEVVTMTIDLWGDHGTNLSNTEIRNLAPGAHSLSGTWSVYKDSDATELWATVAYVAGVRTESGAVYRADIQAVLKEVNKIGARLTEADFSDSE